MSSIFKEEREYLIKLVKIDAEGGEPEVLQGLNVNCNKIEYITIDVSAERFENGRYKSTAFECLDYLYKRGFRLIGSECLLTYTLLFKNNL